MPVIDRVYTVRRDGERLDQIARAELGTWTGGVVEAVLTLNPGLAALGRILPVGTVVNLPPRPDPAPARKQISRLWGDA